MNKVIESHRSESKAEMPVKNNNLPKVKVRELSIIEEKKSEDLPRLSLKHSYLEMEDDELERRGITGQRKLLALFLTQRVYDWVNIVTVPLYTVFLFVLFFADDFIFDNQAQERYVPDLVTDLEFHKTFEQGFRIPEIVFLALFMIDFCLYSFAFRNYFLKVNGNILELFVLLANFAYVVVLMTVDSPYLSRRGILLILRFVILYRKLHQLGVRMGRSALHNWKISAQSDRSTYRTEAEIVLEKLSELMERMD